jgi:hypothetical protein
MVEALRRNRTSSNSERAIIMSNGTWKRSTTASRRTEREIRYAHVSVSKRADGAILEATRTSIGSGSTATRRERRNAKRKLQEKARIAAYWQAIEDDALLAALGA